MTYNEDDYNRYQVYSRKTNLTDDYYYKDSSINQSAIKEYIESPDNLWANHVSNTQRIERKTSDAMVKGGIYHAVIESKLKNLSVLDILLPTTLKRKNTKKWNELQENNQDKVLVKESLLNDISNAVDLLLNHNAIKPLLEDIYCSSEMEIYWSEYLSENEYTSHAVPCKAKIDYFNCKNMIDWKSTRATTLDEFNIEINKYKYYMQSAWYARALMRWDNYAYMCDNQLTDHTPLGDSLDKYDIWIIGQNLSEPDLIFPVKIDFNQIGNLDEMIIEEELWNVYNFLRQKRIEQNKNIKLY